MRQQFSRTPGDDLIGYLTRYPQELTFGDEDPAAVFGRYHTDDFVLRNDGVRLDRERLLAHVEVGRRNATQVNVEVHDALASGGQVAARYTLTAVMRRGQVITTEIHMFGQLAADGRLCRVEQLSRDVSRKDSSSAEQPA
ncbi:nuclear transport factor 2 family protein [Actinoplanes solisilvae]|uniref:nuclear transport factor 2 family protein n=1 Tax=Actinoplanes solisilvae TaxID=2486853 RepID=UPI000FDCA63A|nr:nuclear transport factor 2 family protein [Actinoplanes solisilvae]